MEPLFSIQTKMTYEEYRRFVFCISNKQHHLLFTSILLPVLFVLSGIMGNQPLFFIAAVIAPLLVYFIYIGIIKNTYNSNKAIQNETAEISFYTEHFEMSSSLGNSRIEYSKLYKIYETKTNFYLLVAKNQGAMIQKQNCTDKLCNFIRNLKV